MQLFAFLATILVDRPNLTAHAKWNQSLQVSQLIQEVKLSSDSKFKESGEKLQAAQKDGILFLIVLAMGVTSSEVVTCG